MTADSECGYRAGEIPRFRGILELSVRARVGWRHTPHGIGERLFTTLSLVAWPTAIYAGFAGWSPVWLLALALPIFAAEMVRGPTFDLFMQVRGRLRTQTGMLLTRYVISCVSVLVTYGIGMGVSALVS